MVRNGNGSGNGLGIIKEGGGDDLDGDHDDLHLEEEANDVSQGQSQFQLAHNGGNEDAVNEQTALIAKRADVQIKGIKGNELNYDSEPDAS